MKFRQPFLPRISEIPDLDLGEAKQPRLLPGRRTVSAPMSPTRILIETLFPDSPVSIATDLQHDNSRINTPCTRTEVSDPSFDTWYRNNPHWPSFHDTDIHMTWDGNPQSVADVDIRIQLLAYAGKEYILFNHDHPSVQDWQLAFIDTDPSVLWFRDFDDQPPIESSWMDTTFGA